jgi:signal transduction histidine kinase
VEAGRFLSAVSIDHDRAGTVHDLGNLVQVASSALNIISREIAGSENLSEVMATARSSLDRAGSLIRHRLGAARMAALVEPVDLGRCVTDLLPTLRSVAGPGVMIALTALAGPRVRCDVAELENVVLNLVLNARDAMPEGGILSIAVGELGDGPFLRVADTGCGMSPEIRARAFEPFFTTKGERGGSGIGLPMVARFAADVGGRVELDSAPGAGTSVTLVFASSCARGVS